ncbi:hypothetical protein FD09_GL003040 [Schleiferilactobacillus perolens DSM 12744]|uniref:HTH cro/C1-type domain-containing protein n=2 Tax=Schleiferilactobacillus perolens TaxID=100468 RepID=A0A0R1MWB2_9LACO|nr:hypothetical protein FD09_GL003040 [Schleiferilactobacillus perolens DSM 12744]
MMITYGPTIRRLRTNQHLPQKAVYTGIVSRSFYAKFEKGETNISADKLFALLQRLNIGVTEFLYQHRGMEPSVTEKLRRQIRDNYQQGNFKALRAFYATNRYHALPEMRALAVTAYALVYITGHNSLHMSNAPIVEFQAVLQNTPDWTLEQARLSAETNFLLPLTDPLHHRFFRQIIQTLLAYRSFSDEIDNDLADAYLNEIQPQLLAGHLDTAARLVTELQTISADSQAIDIQFVLTFCRYLVGLYTDFPVVEKQLPDLLSWIDKLNLPFSRDYHLITEVHWDRGRNHYLRRGYFQAKNNDDPQSPN